MARKPFFFPTIEAEFQTWLLNFLETADTYRDDLGISKDQYSKLKGAVSDFLFARAEVEPALQAYHAAVAEKDETKQLAIEVMRELTRQIQGTPKVTPDLKALLGINPGLKKDSRSTPEAPTGVRVTPTVYGYTRIAWKHGSNPRGTLYLVERSLDGHTWTLAGACVTASFDDSHRPDDSPAFYRITAQRRNVSSEPSVVVGSYFRAA